MDQHIQPEHRRRHLLWRSFAVLWCGTLGWGASAEANYYGIQSSNFQDQAHLQAVMADYAATGTSIDEMAMSPDGNWIVIAGASVEHSVGFNAFCLAKVNQYIAKGREIDCVAFAPSGGWVVIAEDLFWYTKGLSMAATLKEQILGRIDAGQRMNELAFDADGDGWTLISGNWAYSPSVPEDLKAAILARHDSKRQIRQISIAPDGRWVLLADDWYASRNLTSTCIDWLKGFQKTKKSLDRILLGLGGNWILYSNGPYHPDMTDPLKAIEYGLAENIWKQIDDAKVAGISVAVIDGYELKYARTYGEAEAGTQRFLRADTPMDTASVSKFITAMTMMSLVDSNHLQFDTSVLDLANAGWADLTKYGPLNVWLEWAPVYNPGVPLPAGELTLSRLLSHSACLEPWGSTSYKPGDTLPNTFNILLGHTSNGAVESFGTSNMVQYNQFILGDGVPYVPGDVWRYSGGGFMVAQAMCESVIPASFEAVAKSRIFDRLEMPNSTYEAPLPASFVERAAVPHGEDGAPVAPSQRRVYPWAAAGGLWSTPTDLSHALIAMMNLGTHPKYGQVLELDTALAMMTKQAGGTTEYGFGLTLSDPAVSPYNSEWFTHNGSHTNEAKARVAANPGLGSGIVILVNTGSDASEALMDEIFDVFRKVYGWPKA